MALLPQRAPDRAGLTVAAHMVAEAADPARLAGAQPSVMQHLVEHPGKLSLLTGRERREQALDDT